MQGFDTVPHKPHMKALVQCLMTNVNLPLMLDSAEWQKMEAGLKVAEGKCILNSTNYEDGEPRFYKVLGLAKRFGAGVVVGTINEKELAIAHFHRFGGGPPQYRRYLGGH